MKVYVGVNTGIGPQEITVRTTGKDARAPYPLKHVERHSPDGFQWGYAGSGPADTARSILIDCVGLATADRYYQQFKFDFIAKAGRDLIVYELEILNWLKDKEANDA